MKSKNGIGLKSLVLIIAVIIVLVIVGVILVTKNSSKASDNESATSGVVKDNSSLNTNKNDVNKSKKELICNSTEAFRFSDVDDGVIITQFINYDYVEYDKIIIPETIDGKPVVGIGALKKTDTYYGKVLDNVFGNCEVVIPDTVKYIGGEAFEGADGLVRLSGGQNCTAIGEHAFMNCVNLSEITFINNVTDLADNAFTGCTKWNANH